MIIDHSRLLSWSCVTDAGLSHREIVGARAQLADAARHARWREVFSLLDDEPTHVMGGVEPNDVRVGGASGSAPLHQAAWHGARATVIEGLLRRGAWRSLRSTSGETPEDVARRRGHDRLAERIAAPSEASHGTLLAIEARFAELIAKKAPRLNMSMRMPQLGPLVEYPDRPFHCGIPMMFGGVFYQWADPERRDALVANFSSRMDAGPETYFRVTSCSAREVERDAGAG